MVTELDLGERCDRHVGEVFPPRCADCDALQVATAADVLGARLANGPTQGAECPLHHGYPTPCARCQREAGDRSVPVTSIPTSGWNREGIQHG